MAGYSLKPHALTALSHAVNRQEAQAPLNRGEDNNPSDKSQVPLCVYVYNVNICHWTNRPYPCDAEPF